MRLEEEHKKGEEKSQDQKSERMDHTKGKTIHKETRRKQVSPSLQEDLSFEEDELLW